MSATRSAARATAVRTDALQTFTWVGKDKRGVVPNYSGMEGFVAAKLFTEVLRRAGRNLTRESFLATIDGLQKIDLGGFTLEFGPRQRVGSRFVELTLLTEDGRVRR